MKLSSIENVFMTSDHHFGHKNILKYCNRAFETIVQMNEFYINQWNKITDAKSIIFHHGDFTLCADAEKYFNRLNGQIYVIGLHWHHDKRWLKHECRSATGQVVKILAPIAILQLPIKTEKGYARVITMSHYPLQEWEASFYAQWHTFGHTHCAPGTKFKPGSINVGVDYWDGIVPLNKIVNLLQTKSEV